MLPLVAVTVLSAGGVGSPGFGLRLSLSAFAFVSVTFEPSDDVAVEAGVLGDLADEGLAVGGGLERGDLIRQRFDLLVGRFELCGVVAFAGVVFGGFGLVFVVSGVSGFEFRFFLFDAGGERVAELLGVVGRGVLHVVAFAVGVLACGWFAFASLRFSAFDEEEVAHEVAAVAGDEVHWCSFGFCARLATRRAGSAVSGWRRIRTCVARVARPIYSRLRSASSAASLGCVIIDADKGLIDTIW